MIEKIFRCDVCGRTKGEANKWFSCARSTLDFGPFSPDAHGHVCSEECAHKLLAQVLQKVRDSETEEKH